MTEFTNEPLWVGMDVDVELARYAEQDRRRAQAERTPSPTSPRSLLKRVRRAATLPRTGGGVPRFPLAA